MEFDDMNIDFDESPKKDKEAKNDQTQEKKETKIEEELDDDWDDFDDNDDDGWGELEESIDYNTRDLNKMSRKNVETHKQKMDIEFQKNSIKKGDKGYVYDKEVEFQPGKEENEWDMSMSFDD